MGTVKVRVRDASSLHSTRFPSARCSDDEVLSIQGSSKSSLDFLVRDMPCRLRKQDDGRYGQRLFNDHEVRAGGSSFASDELVVDFVQSSRARATQKGMTGKYAKVVHLDRTILNPVFAGAWKPLVRVSKYEVRSRYLWAPAHTPRSTSPGTSGRM